MPSTPTDIANLALDACGVDVQLGSLEEGGAMANRCLRAFAKCRQELLRAAPWTFARKQATLTLLADASGSTPGVGTVVPGTQFIYEYEYPIDCARIRYIPWNPFLNPGVPINNFTPPFSPAPPVQVSPSPSVIGMPIRPSLFVITNDPNFPTTANPETWLYEQGQSPEGSTVILSNVPQASLVYTFDAVYISLWDSLFRNAMVSYMASEIAMAVWVRNSALGLKVRADQIAITKQKITEARIADGNEMSVSTAHVPDWMRVRRVGGPYGWGPWGAGGFEASGGFGSWGTAWGGSISFSDGSAY